MLSVRIFSMNWLRVPVMALAIASLSGCFLTQLGGTNYERSEARTLQNVYYGEIVDIEVVDIEGTDTGVGAMAGAATGGIAGSNIGRGRGRAVGTIAGAVLGGVLGQAAERGMTKTTGVNITVRLDNGQDVSVVQQGGGFRVGDRVKVLSNSRSSRIVHAGR